MSTLKHGLSTKLFMLLLALLFLFSQAACSPPQQAAASNALSAISNGVDAALAVPDEIVFAGQISGINGRWANNYVVVLFKNGEEVTRSFSRLLDSPLTELGPMDGVFELRIINEYKLTTDHDFYQANGTAAYMRNVTGVVGTAYVGTWFDNLHANSIRIVSIPDKQLEYGIVVLPVPSDELPDGYQPGNLSLMGQTLVTNQADAVVDEQTAIQVTAVPVPTAVTQSNVQLIFLPSRNNGLDWHLQMKGYYGNRWDVWEKYVAGRGHSMSWETFKESVLVHNPHLEDDNFVFYPDKVYLLPATP